MSIMLSQVSNNQYTGLKSKNCGEVRARAILHKFGHVRGADRPPQYVGQFN